VFLTSLEIGHANALARVARTAAIWLPFVAITGGTLLGYFEFFTQMIDGTPWHFGQTKFVLTHLLVAAIVILLHLWIAVECKQVLKQLDELLAVPGGAQEA
jgi:hypothetical protein